MKAGLSRRRALARIGACAMAGTAGPARVRAQPAPRSIAWPESLPMIGTGPLTRDVLLQHAVVLGFSSRTCSYCLRQDAHLQRLHALAGQELLVVGVSTDGDGPDVLAWARSQGWTFPWTSAHQPLARLFDARRVLPRTYLVGRGGVLLRAIAGEMFESDVLELADIARQHA